MKKSLTIVIISALLLACGSSNKTIPRSIDSAISTPIETTIDLTKVIDDKVPVIINPGRFTVESVTYSLPKVIPGTYEISNFGSFIDNFKAFDYSGKEMVVTKADVNSWVVNNARNLDKISYLVNDTFDIEISGELPTPRSMSGTNIETDNYVLSLHGFIGYFDLLKNNQYKLEVTATKDFVRTSSLQKTGSTTSQDGTTITTNYFASRYFDIIDNPMMYGKLDVEEFQVDDIKITLSVYSPNNIHSAKSLKEAMFKMMEAQKKYLGNINSTTNYAIYVYLSRGDGTSPHGFGALEHHTSTVVVMPEAMPSEALANQMIDIVSHEFFHIVTPLSVHSEDVHYFNYSNPTFSKHLWMYEGLTEYFAQHFQVYEGLVSEDEFYSKIMNKIQTSKGLDDTMSFTVMSENVLDQPYKDNYLNVYNKGALIGMCMDILIREGSQGKRGILSLMKELSLKYGTNKPFEDDKIITEIVAMTYPSLRDFFDKNVIGSTPIYYNYYFDKTGLELKETRVETNYIQNAGAYIFGMNQQKGYVYFNELVTNNSFWNENGILPNDIIKTVNSTGLNLKNAHQMLGQLFQWQPGREIEMKIERDGVEIVIKTTLTQSYTITKSLQHKSDASDKQNALRKAWLKG